MGRLVVIGNGPVAEIFLRQVLHFPRDFPITIFGGTFLDPHTDLDGQDGVDVQPDIHVVDIDRHALVVQGDDGSRTPYERLVLATGRKGFRPSGLQARDGILVNHNFETSDGHIYAIGDCAEPREAEDRISGLWQARTLAAMLVGNASQVPTATINTRGTGGKLLFFPAPLPSKDDPPEGAQAGTAHRRKSTSS